jgi:replicative DNA helicase
VTDTAQPPHNVEAEQQLLGALLCNNGVYERVAAIVKPEHFYDPVHARIFETIIGHVQRDQIATPVTLRAFFDDDPGLAELGGLAYLVRLAGAAISLFACADYARLIYDLAVRRELILTLQDSLAAAYDPDKPTDAIVGAIETFQLGQEARDDGKVVSLRAAVTSAFRDMSEAYQNGEVPGVKTGLRGVDDLLGSLRKGNMIVLAGRPSMGKSAVALQIAMNAARAGHGVGFASREMTPEELAARAMSEATARAGRGVKYVDAVRGDVDESQMRALIAGAKDVAELPIYFMPPTTSTVGGVLASARRLVRKFAGEKRSLDLLVLDYIQIMEAASKSGRNEIVTEISGATKALARVLDIPVLALAQLSRGVEGREDKRPLLSDLRDSGAIEQDADAVIFCYREEYYLQRSQPPEHDIEKRMLWSQSLANCAGCVDLIVAKQRMGPTGSVRAWFDPATNWTRDVVERSAPDPRQDSIEGFA